MKTHYQPSDLQSTSTKQLAFMAVLSPDILLEIFSLIDQRDCLTCMTVCRDWFNIVPEYAKSLWKIIDISKNGAQMSRKCWERCLGDHVKKVTLRAFFPEQVLYNVLQKLLDLKCSNIESLDLANCITTRHSVFLNLLRKFPLTHLRMLVHQSNVPFAHVLNACPNMTHFTYQLGVAKNTFYKEPVVVNAPKLADQFPNVIYLCLDVPLHNEKRLEPLLRRCPNLKCYVGVGTEKFSNRKRDYTSIDCEKLLTYCPKISHLVTDWCYNTLSVVDDIASSSLASANGLQTFAVAQHRYTSDRIRPILASHQSTIEHLHLIACDPLFDDGDSSWPDVFVSLPPPNLRTLICNTYFRINGPSLASLISPTLEKLKIGDGSSLELNKNLLLQSLPVVPLLHTFECSQLTLDTDSAVVALLERLPALEYLALSFATLTYTFFASALESLQNLKDLDLSNITWVGDIWKRPFTKLSASKLKSVRIVYTPSITYELLLSFIHSPSLMRLHIAMDYTLCANDVDGLRQLVATLSSVRSLDISNLQRVPFAVFDALAKLPLLDLYLDNGRFDNPVPSLLVDKSGLIHLLRTSKSLTVASFGRMVVIDNMDNPGEDDSTDYVSCEAVRDLIKKHAPAYQFNIPVQNKGMTQIGGWPQTGVTFRRITR